MYQMFLKSLREWNASYNERSKLQHSYVAFAMLAIVVAGLVGLADYNLGQQLTSLALIALGVFFVNLIAWTLLSGLVLSGLQEPPTSSRSSTAKQTAKSSKKR